MRLPVMRTESGADVSAAPGTACNSSSCVSPSRLKFVTRSFRFWSLDDSAADTFWNPAIRRDRS